MKDLLQHISRAALALNDGDFSEQQRRDEWLGFSTTTVDTIEATEKRLGTTLPEDYKRFIVTTNGLAATSGVEPTFLPIEEIDYLNKFDSELVDIWRMTGNEEVADQLVRSICIAGREEEQQFLLIPLTDKGGPWLYWKFAYWIPGAETYKGLEQYFEYVLSFLQEELNR